MRSEEVGMEELLCGQLAPLCPLRSNQETSFDLYTFLGLFTFTYLQTDLGVDSCHAFPTGQTHRVAILLFIVSFPSSPSGCFLFRCLCVVVFLRLTNITSVVLMIPKTHKCFRSRA